MTKARRELISLEDTPYYHCVARCVRRAYLFGEDPVTGVSYDHRKQWIVSRLRFLSYIYAIDIAAYAVMSNHYHVVLHVDTEQAAAWSPKEVVERWMQLFNGHVLVNRWQAGDELDQAQLDFVFNTIETWRERLTDISWFMRCVNETIAGMANAEDGCKGRFWEGRFKSQALLDEAAVLTCMAYVDLNPVRAGIADTPERSDFTSLQQRLLEYGETKRRKTNAQKEVVRRLQQQEKLKQDMNIEDWPQAPLMPIDGSSHTSVHCAIRFTREDYIELVDATGRAIREDKKGFIPEETPSVLVRFGVDASHWIEQIRGYGKSYCHCVGSVTNIRQYAERCGQSWFRGIGAAKRASAR